MSTGAPRRIRRSALGWVLVALVESAVYIALARALTGRGDRWGVLALASAALIVTVLVSRAGYVSGARLAGDLYDRLGQALAPARLSWFTAENRALVGDVAGRSIPTLMGVPAHQLQTFVLAPLIPLLLVIGTAVVAGAATAAIVLLLLLVSFGVQFLAQRMLARADAERHECEQAAARATLELVDHRELLRTAIGPSRALARVSEVWVLQEDALARTNRAAAPATFLSALASVLPGGGALVLLALSGGFADPAAALALIVLTMRAGAPLEELALAGIAAGELRATIRSFRRVAEAPRLPEAADGRRLPHSGHEIRLEAVAMRPAFEGVTATIPPGAHVHVAGPTGSGKSTLLGLLMRFDDPQEGAVVLGGVPLPSLAAAELAAAIAYVPQDPVVFTGTLAENVRLGRPGADDDRVRRAVRAAGLEDVVARDARGIHQPVGLAGGALSGGERQRVCIARALLKDAPILILDEATSALDEERERQVVAAIVDTPATVVFVTHRDAGIWRPDIVLSLGEGAE